MCRDDGAISHVLKEEAQNSSVTVTGMIGLSNFGSSSALHF